MNPTVRYIISFLLQLPIYCVVVNGPSALFGLNIWLSVLICIALFVMYDIGELIRRND